MSMEIEEQIEDFQDELTLDERIQALYEAGITSPKTIHNKVIRKVSVSLRTVERKVNSLRNRTRGKKQGKKGHRAKFLTEEKKEEIVMYLQDYPYASAEDIKRDLNYAVSLRTIQRALKEIGYFYLRVRKEPLITPKTKSKRLSFARKNLDRDWGDCVFADETTFIAYGYPKLAYQTHDERKGYMCPKKPIKINVWGGISARGTTDLYLFEENLTGPLYRKILKTCLIYRMEYLYQDQPWVLVEDNDPKHNSTTVQNFFHNHRIKVMRKWPSYSPDLNPIENIWSILKRKVDEEQPKTKRQLEQAIIRQWRHISQDAINNAINSMHSRLEQVIYTKGSKIAY